MYLADLHAGCRGLGGEVGPTTITVDVLGPEGGPKMNVTVYLVDFERFGRQLALETREYNTMQIGGTYATLFVLFSFS